MLLTDAPFNGAAELMRDDSLVRGGYGELLSVLAAATVSRHGRVKAKPQYVYDQSALQRQIRSELTSVGWTHGIGLAADWQYDGVQMSGVRADLIGRGCHVILEFGNRASWALNLLTRGVGSVGRDDVRLLVYVAPSARFADQVDTNVATFERIAASIKWILTRAPQSVPLPLVVVGVDVESRRE